MKKILILLISFIFNGIVFAHGTPSDLSVVCTPSSGYQGFLFDGTNFFVGNSSDDKVYKYTDTCADVTSFSSPTHPSEIDLRTDHDNLIVSTGSTNNAVVWEITKAGTKVREWDFSGESSSHGYSQGALVCYAGEDNTIFLLTSNTSPPYDFKIAKYTLADDGSFTWVKTWNHSSLGIPQGLEYDGAYIYYSVTVTSGSDNRVYKLQLNISGVSIDIIDYAAVTVDAEIEGISLYNNYIYYNEYEDRKIRKFNSKFFITGSITIGGGSKTISTGGSNTITIVP